MGRTLLFYLFAQVLWPQVPSVKTGIVVGQVVNAKTGEPIAKATLRLNALDRPAGSTEQPIEIKTATDSQGRFIIGNVPPGRYVLISFQSSGFEASEFGAKRRGGPGMPILVPAGERTDGLILRLVPLGAATGRVLDEDGEPVEHASVQAQTFRFESGRRTLVTAGQATTNDLGAFRIAKLPAGQYFLVAGFYRVAKEATPGGGLVVRRAADTSFAPTYYPGTVDARAAASIDVPAGEEAGGLTIKLLKKAAYTIRGKVTQDLLPGSPNLSVVLAPLGSDISAALAGTLSGIVDGKGNFEIRGVPPGSYAVYAWVGTYPNNFQTHCEVGVYDKDVDGVEVRFAPRVRVTGKVRLKDKTARDMTGISVLLRPRADGFALVKERGTHVREDGGFEIEDVEAGLYDVELFHLPEGFYMEAAHSGDRNVLDLGFECAGKIAPLEIVLSPASATVDGVALDDKNQQPVAGATVALVPQEDGRRNREMYYRTAVADASGRFSLSGIVPGTYKFFAWDDIEPGAYMDPEFMKQWESKVTAKTIREGAREAVSLSVLHSETAK
jgi:hypothetical protein